MKGYQKTLYQSHKECVEKASRDLLAPSDATNRSAPNYRILGTFVEKKEGLERTILLVEEGSDQQEVEAIAEQAFGHLNYKIVYVDGVAEGSGNSLVNGSQIISKFGAGSLGGIFRKTGFEGVFGLSNNHVIAGCGAGQIGDEILDPQQQLIGKLSGGINLKPLGVGDGINHIDAAIFQFETGVETGWEPVIPEHPPVGASPGLKVYKRGAKTGETRGEVRAIGSAFVRLCGREYLFKDILTIVGNGPGHFNDHGDSGSLVLTENHHPVAIVFAKYGPYCYACRVKYLGGLGLDW